MGLLFHEGFHFLKADSVFMKAVRLRSLETKAIFQPAVQVQYWQEACKLSHAVFTCSICICALQSTQKE